MITILFLGFPAYVTARIAAIILLHRGWRWASLLPGMPMLFVVAATIKACSDQSNLWPLLLLFASPVALAYILVLLALHWLLQIRPRDF